MLYVGLLGGIWDALSSTAVTEQQHPDELIDIHSASLWFLSPWSSRGTVEVALLKNQETWPSSQLPLACLLREAVAIPTRTRTEQKQVTSGTSGRLQGGHIHQRRSGLLNCVSARHAIKNISQQTDKTTCFFPPVDDKDDSRSIDHMWNTLTGVSTIWSIF